MSVHAKPDDVKRTVTRIRRVTVDMKRNGFTLLELLVVVGIAALMAAIAFPVFSQAREKARQALCLGNERQLGAALLMYAHDNDNYLPMNSNGWAGAISPDVRSIGVFHCPSDTTGERPPYYPVSYGVNADLWHVIAISGGRHMLVPHSLGEVSAKTVSLFEVVHAATELATPGEGWSVDKPVPAAISAAGNGGPLSVIGFFIGSGIKYDADEDVRYATGVMSGADRFGEDMNAYYEGSGRHEGGSNFLYSDMHVKWLTPQQVSTGADAITPNDAPSVPGPSLTVVSASGSENSRFSATFSTR